MMRKVLRIARREYRANVRTKGFVIGIVLAPVLMGGSGLAYALLKDRVDTDDKQIAILDRSGQVAESLVEAAARRNETVVHDPGSGKKVRSAYLLEVVDPQVEHPEDQRLGLSDRIRDGSLDAFLDVGAGVLHPRVPGADRRIAYHAKNPALDPARNWLSNVVNGRLRDVRARDAGLTDEALTDLFDWIEPEGLGLLSRDLGSGAVKPAERKDRLQAILVPLALAMLLLLMVMMGAAGHLHSTMEEKSQRIAEVLLGSIEPFPFMLGKLLGGVGVSLTAAAVYLTTGVIAVYWCEVAHLVPWNVLPWFLVYLLLAIPMYGALFAALGSACNDPSEAQAMLFPAILPVMLPMFVQMPVIMNPDSTFAFGLSMFPLFTPTVMMMRMATPTGVAVWEPWVGLVGVVLCTALLVWAGGRIFRVAILVQGTPPKFGNLLRWALRG